MKIARYELKVVHKKELILMMEDDVDSEELLKFFLCHSKNKPPAMQGEGKPLDISMSSCAMIRVGLQNHK